MKTIDEAAKEYISEFGDEAFKAGVEFAQKWIDVNDELPEKFKDEFSTSPIVIAKSEQLEWEFTAYYIHKLKQWKLYPSLEYTTVTHWRPIELV